MNLQPTKVALSRSHAELRCLVRPWSYAEPTDAARLAVFDLDTCCEEDFNTDQSGKGAASDACRVLNGIEQQTRVREQRYGSSAVVSLSGFIRQEPLMD